MSKTVETGWGCDCHDCLIEEWDEEQGKVTMAVTGMEASEAKGTECRS